jgi:hypothetical protein
MMREGRLGNGSEAENASPAWLAFPLCLALLLAFTGQSALAGTSRLWGEKGEAWDPLGRLPDFSYAGYRAGESAIPDVPVIANAKDHGCKGDGKTDDSQCLQNAIDSLGKGALLIPKGRYLLTRQITVRKPGTVLRGEGGGADGTVLFWSKNLQDLTGNNYPANWGVSGLLRFAPPQAAAAPAAAGLAKTADHPPAKELALGPVLARVVAEAKRGDYALRVDAPAAFRAGQWIVLTLTDPADRSLNAHLHNGQGSNDDNQDMPLHWIARIASMAGALVQLSQPLRCDVRLAWNPTLNAYRPLEDCGLEDVRLEFPDLAYPGHQLEHGFNAFSFEGARDCWARRIVIKNADNGPSLEELTKNCSVLDLTQLPRSVLAINGRISGHHGFSFNIDSHDNLLAGFDFQAAFIHGVSVGYNASGNVARSGHGTDLNLDHHGRTPFENLYTDLDLGMGAYPYIPVAGAGGDPLRSGARGTVWNVRIGKGPVPPPPFDYVQFNVVGTDRDSMTRDREWLEKIDQLSPPDLYLSQLQRRLAVSSAVRPRAGSGAPGKSGSESRSGRKAYRADGRTWHHRRGMPP